MARETTSAERFRRAAEVFNEVRRAAEADRKRTLATACGEDDLVNDDGGGKYILNGGPLVYVRHDLENQKFDNGKHVKGNVSAVTFRQAP